jgi:nucleoside-diphosphate-sugar epimerase
MRVVVTGAGGRVGTVVMELLRDNGFDVLGLDRVDGSAVRRIDLRELDHVTEALAGAHAVVHLAAIPSPKDDPPEVVYGNNTMTTFHVFEAAARLGIPRVVSASSLCAYGFPFQLRWTDPDYLPLDEEHPLRPQDSYGLSKVVGEQIASAYAARGAGNAVSLRFSTVIIGDELFAQARRAPRPWASHLWSYVYSTDVARAILLSLTSPIDGHEVFNITAGDTTMDVPTDELLDEHFPSVPRRAHRPNPRWSLVDCSRAADRLGWRPSR